MRGQTRHIRSLQWSHRPGGGGVMPWEIATFDRYSRSTHRHLNSPNDQLAESSHISPTNRLNTCRQIGRRPRATNKTYLLTYLLIYQLHVDITSCSTQATQKFTTVSRSAWVTCASWLDGESTANGGELTVEPFRPSVSGPVFWRPGDDSGVGGRAVDEAKHQ